MKFLDTFHNYLVLDDEEMATIQKCCRNVESASPRSYTALRELIYIFANLSPEDAQELYHLAASKIQNPIPKMIQERAIEYNISFGAAKYLTMTGQLPHEAIVLPD